MRVLDLACGKGRHSIAAAARGCYVTSIDKDPTRFKEAQEYCASKNHNVEWIVEDLETCQLESKSYDMVLVFNYLDRNRWQDFKEAVKPGGFFLCETFTEWQRAQGWGPTSDDHLLKSGELPSLMEPFDLILGRDVLEMVDGQPMAAASAFAKRLE